MVGALYRGWPSEEEFQQVLEELAELDARAEENRRAELPKFLKADEVAALLRVNRNTIYEAAQRDEIPGLVRIGRALRFRRDSILAWIDFD